MTWFLFVPAGSSSPTPTKPGLTQDIREPAADPRAISLGPLKVEVHPAPPSCLPYGLCKRTLQPKEEKAERTIALEGGGFRAMRLLGRLLDLFLSLDFHTALIPLPGKTTKAGRRTELAPFSHLAFPQASFSLRFLAAFWCAPSLGGWARGAAGARPRARGGRGLATAGGGRGKGRATDSRGGGVRVGGSARVRGSGKRGSGWSSSA